MGQLHRTSTSVGQLAGFGAPVNKISKIDSQPEADQPFSILGNSQQLDSLGKELMVDAAHALRSPLSSIKGYSSTLLQTDVSWPPEVRQEFLETIDREADQLTGAINEFLGSMEAELGKVHLDRRPVPVQNLFWIAEPDVVGDGVGPIWFHCEADLPPVMVDEDRIAQVIVNLTNFARSAVSSGATLTTRAHRMEERIRIVIGHAKGHADGGYGSGVSPTLINKEGRFSPTWVHKELMLSICKTVLLAHGVELHQEPPEREEEIFWFELPVALPQPAER